MEYTQDTFRASEGDEQLSVVLRKDKVIANPVEINIVPQTFQEAGISPPSNVFENRSVASMLIK